MKSIRIICSGDREIAICYYRSGYSPQQYLSEDVSLYNIFFEICTCIRECVLKGVENC